MSEFNEQEWIDQNYNKIIKNGIGKMSECSGCYESVDGHNSLGYPISKTFGCYIGSGCDECENVGVVEADYTDYEYFIKNQKLEERLKEAEKVIEFYAKKINWQDCRIKNDFITGIDMVLDREYFYVGGKKAREYQQKYMSEDSDE